MKIKQIIFTFDLLTASLVVLCTNKPQKIKFIKYKKTNMFDHMEETLTKTKREKQKFLGQYIETGWILN